MPIAKTTNGSLRGKVENGVVTFRGVPYATCERFSQPRLVEPWEGERDATVDGPIAPQAPSRLEPVMGIPEAHKQAEDCLTVTITTPGVDEAARPVLVWFHGGGWVSGAGCWELYDARRLVCEGDVVVVAVNHRLGMLGYLRAPGISEGNLGLADQLDALRWVRDNIAAFGGDPTSVTVAGQSAGAHTVQCLLGMPGARGLFRRAIIQSSPAVIGLGSARAARRTAERFLSFIGVDPRIASVSAILQAQAETLRASAGRFQLNIASGITPIPGVGELPDKAGWEKEAANRAPDLDIIIGTTAQEMAAFYAKTPALQRVRGVPVLGDAIAGAVQRLVGSLVFVGPGHRLADWLAKAGARVWVYRFDYAAPASPFGAAHCIELPFLLGTAKAWAGAPMLAGAKESDLDTFGRRLRKAWLGFIRTGIPTADPYWPQYSADAPTVRRWNA